MLSPRSTLTNLVRSSTTTESQPTGLARLGLRHRGQNLTPSHETSADVPCPNYLFMMVPIVGTMSPSIETPILGRAGMT